MSHSTKRVVFSDGDIRRMIEAYSSGNSFLDIANEYKCAKNTVRKYLLLSGITTDRKRSISVKAKGRRSPNKGKKWTEKTRSKFMESSKKREQWGGRIGVYDANRRLNISNALKERYKKYGSPLKGRKILITNKRKDCKRFLTDEERLLRNKQRLKYKNCLRRFIRATGKKKCSKTESLLGYSQKEFASHIEKQFKPGMSWADRESFHVDHKIPVAEFFRRGITDPKIVCALENLQPLFPKENRMKSDKVPSV